MGVKHKAKRIAREAGMPNCNPKTGAFLYVTPAPHGFAGDDRSIYWHYRQNVYGRALIRLQRAAGMPGPDRRRGWDSKARDTRPRSRGAPLVRTMRRVENRWRDWDRA